MEDYRIVGAIINCFFCKLFSDHGNENEIVSEMKKKSEQKTYSLEKYLNGFQETNFVEIDANDVHDFPKLSEEIIQKKITLGSYQLNNCRSYLAEHFNSNGKLEILINRNSIKDHDNSILVASIQSRHIRKMKYGVVIAYKPDIKDITSIYSWTCTCKVGKRIVGCCSHVAAIVFYLSFGMYQKDLKKPGMHLNRIFDMHVDDDDHPEDCCCLLKGKDESSIDGISDIFEDEEEFVESQLIGNENKIINKRKITTSSSLETFSYKLKIDDHILNKLIEILPKWGGNISEYDSFQNFKITDTCTIDYFLLGIAFSCIKMTNYSQILLTGNRNQHLCQKIEQIVNLILIKNWNKAKSIWILEILKLEPKRRIFSTFGDEDTFFISHIKTMQRLNHYCKTCDEVFYTNDEIYIHAGINNNIIFNFNEIRKCNICGCEQNVDKLFEETPCWLFIQNLIRNMKRKRIMFYDLPPQLIINEKKYLLLMCTYLKGHHFKSIFTHDDHIYFFDDLKEGLTENMEKHEVSSCIYYLHE